MKKLALAASLAVVAALATPAAAQGAYAGAGYTHYDGDGADVGGVTGRLGYNFTPHLGVEGEASFGVGDDDGVELDNAYGVYGVGRLPISESFEVLGRVGYQQTEISTGAQNDGVGYGVGAQWNVTPNFGIRGDYTRLDGDEEIDTLGVGGVVKF